MPKLFRKMMIEAENTLRESGIRDSNTDVWILSEHLLGINKQKYYMNMNMEIDDVAYETYMQSIAKRSQHIPLQHITGHQEFMGLDFFVDENVLIPRQDTELLVEKALDIIRAAKQDEPIKVLDMCTGSGCIAISVAKLGKNVNITAVDISEKALAVAEKNARHNDVEITFVRSDLFENVPGKYDLILSNPPYIPTEVIDTLDCEVREHEPFIALDGSSDGLLFYEKIAAHAFDYLNKNGMIIFEIGHDQGESVPLILRKKASYVKVYKDLAGNDRVVVARVIGKEEESCLIS